MTRHALALLAVAAVATGLWAAPVPKEFRKRDDRSRLSGAWAQTTDGQGNPTANQCVWVLTDTGTAVIVQPNGSKSETAKYEIDAFADPKTFVWDAPWGKWNGVYDVDGDVFRLALAPATAKAPPAAVAPASGVEFYVFARKKD